MPLRDKPPVLPDPLLDPAVQDCPYDHYRSLRESAPVHRMPDTGYYVLSRHADVRAAMLDTDTYSSQYDYGDIASFNASPMRIVDQALAERGWPHVATLQRQDPPLHGRDRELVRPLFAPRAIKALTSNIEAKVELVIDGFIERGACEFVSDFAVPFPALVMAEQLGLGDHDLPTLHSWVDGMLAPVTRPLNDAEASAAVEAELAAQHHFADLFRRRRVEPGDDIVSWLVASRASGDDAVYSDADLQSIMRFLLTGGLNTTAHALAHGMLYLTMNPGMWEELAADPAQLGRFIEEIIRLDGPVQGLFRRTTKPVDLHDVTIPAGSFVMLRHGAANHDPEVFADPESCDINRQELGQHVGFGAGPHYCIGAPLAREEMRAAFAALLTRIDRPRLAATQPEPAHLPSLMFRGLSRLDLTFEVR
ncbi:cytochrome P450 [Jatrophihabitans sp.]|uniref:cytochrome P450 n=1 Tax=Jatrophihabitans sp. TaxID=1932789 RepID=UPI0030C73544|nr:Cytochrome [Jatrophihabitans sp.]